MVKSKYRKVVCRFTICQDYPIADGDFSSETVNTPHMVNSDAISVGGVFNTNSTVAKFHCRTFRVQFRLPESPGEQMLPKIKCCRIFAILRCVNSTDHF